MISPAPSGECQNCCLQCRRLVLLNRITFNLFYHWLSCLTQNIIRVRYRLDVVQEKKKHFLLWETYENLKYIVWRCKALRSAVTYGTFIYRLVWMIKFFDVSTCRSKPCHKQIKIWRNYDMKTETFSTLQICKQFWGHSYSTVATHMTIISHYEQ